MSYRKLFRWAIACLGVAVLLFAGIHFLKPGERWPQFPKEAVGPAPAVMFDVERDFGWRTGDVIPLTIYIREFPGTSVDVEGLALEGDFEVRGDVKVDSRATADGGRIIRVRMDVQSFAFKPEVGARVSMTWNKAGSKEWEEVPRAQVTVHTSPTWDGRQAIQEGRLQFLQGWHLVQTITVFALSVLGILLSVKLLRYVKRNTPPRPPEPKRPPTLYEWAQMRFDAAWARIEQGDRSDEVFREIDHVTRKLLQVETVQLSHLDIALQSHPFARQGMFIIKTCERKLFRGDTLEDKYVVAIKTAFDQIISRHPRSA